jgi:threonine/homoserine/homoserine lactone efflux protein
MNGITNFETFILSGLLLNITPGSDTILILTRSIAQGKRTGVVSALGIGTGAITHTLLAALGLSILVTSSPVAFIVVKLAGALYLIYIGCKMIFADTTLDFSVADRGADRKSVFRDAYFTNLFNPKVALFFIAFLPQFIDSNAQSTVIPFIILGITFTTTGTLWCILLAIFSAEIFSGLRRNQRFSVVLNKGCGLVLAFVGVYIAFIG